MTTQTKKLSFVTRLVFIYALPIAISVGCRSTEPRPQPATRPDDAVQEQAQKSARQTRSIDYIELLTSGADGKTELPLIVAVHGLGDAPEHFGVLMADLPVPARVILPRAPTKWGTGFAWFTVRIFSGDWAALSDGIASAARLVARLLPHVEKTRPTRGRPILTGFSQGGMISFAVAVNHPETIGLAIPVGGVLPEPLWPKVRDANRTYPPIRALHGEADDLVRFDPTKKAVEHLEKLGFDVTLEGYPEVGHTVSTSMRHRLYEIIQDATRTEQPPSSSRPRTRSSAGTQPG